MTFHPVSTLDEVFAIALLPAAGGPEAAHAMEDLADEMVGAGRA